ncbi:MAG: spondin domain-containing protein [Pseudomonadota bacterium]
MRLVFSLASLALLTACGGGGSSSNSGFPAADAPVVTAEFVVTVTNLTNAQPLSPVALIGHDGSQQIFTLGAPASAGLEVLAEGGDNSELLAAFDGMASVFLTRGGAAPIGPGGSESFSITVNDVTRADLALSIATMLVNTNDAITAVNNMDVSDLAAGERMSVRTIAYDAGTEADTEGPGTIPGPADGGEGFNEARDDEVDRVSMHPGVLSAMDGLVTSVLTEQHRFDNPVAQVVIERVN